MAVARLAGAVSLAAACIGATHSAAQTTDPWALMTRRDLQAIHDLLARNHPGPVDPQNSRYGDWLRQGLTAANQRADAARGYSDYRRALRFYVNGFRDGHISTSQLLSPSSLDWPGFVVARADDGRTRVASGVGGEPPVGAELVSCDGQSVDTLMKERIDPFSWNADIPHARWKGLPSLFVLQPGDSKLRLQRCRFVVDGQPREVALSWRMDSADVVNTHWRTATVGSPPALGLRQVGGVWFVSLPSFGYSGDGAAGIRALIAEIKAKAPELRRSTVVFDVRGNGGGNSGWGNEVAGAFWSEEHVRRVTGSFDWTVDWRVSPENIAHLERITARNERDGLTAGAASWRRATEAMKAAHARGETLVRVASPPKTFEGPPPANPVSGRVFLLTDEACASACLDFADVLRRLPGVRHVGLPTSADAVYIDNTGTTLPSGMANLSYSLKVYRNRVRANNEWYEPQVRWPGGAMTDEALARWIGTLP